MLLLALVPAVMSTLEKTPRDKIGISYGGGPIEGEKFQKIVQPGSGLFFNGLFDSLYLYPADQQNYIISDQEGVGATDGPDSVTAPTADRVQVTYQAAVYFKLNTDELRPFHEQLGLKFSAYTDDGWDQMLQDTFRPQIENALQQETRQVEVADLVGDADVLLELQQSVQATLSQRLEDALGDTFFCAPTFQPGSECADPTFVIQRVDIPEGVASAFEANRTSQVEIQTRQNEVAQREAEAEGIDALGLTGDQYVTLKAVESGKIGFWVLPEDAGVTVLNPNPAGATRRWRVDRADNGPDASHDPLCPPTTAADRGLADASRLARRQGEDRYVLASGFAEAEPRAAGRHGVLYPSRSHSSSHREIVYLCCAPQDLPRGFGTARSAGSVRELGEEFWSGVNAQIDQHQPHTVILSSEYLFRRRVAELEVLRDVFKQRFDDIQVVAYVRHPASHFLSNTQQKVKASARIVPPGRFQFLIPVLMQRFAEVFGPAVTVRPFDLSLLRDGCVVRDFVSAFLPGGEQLAEEIEVLNFNESISAEGMCILQRLRRHGWPGQDDEFRPESDKVLEAIRSVEATTSHTPPELRPAIRDGITAAHADDLRYLRETFGIVFPVPEVVDPAPSEKITGWMSNDVSDIVQVDSEDVDRLLYLVVKELAARSLAREARDLKPKL